MKTRWYHKSFGITLGLGLVALALWVAILRPIWEVAVYWWGIWGW